MALSEIVSVIEENILGSENAAVFMMKDLKIMYQDRLTHLGASSDFVEKVNVTRLKEKLLAQIQGLVEKKKGKHVLLTLDGEIGKAMFEASLDSSQDEGIVLCRAAKIVRKYLFQDEIEFIGDTSTECQKSSVPTHLLHLIGMILEGVTSYDKISKKTEEIATNLSQLIRFNSIKTTRRSKSKFLRHSTKNEPPFPVIVGLMVHNLTRKKGLVQNLAEGGLSISYHRVIEIEQAITKQLCQNYEDEGIVVPPFLEKSLFIVAAIDNIDHNPSSSTATASFHGTSISLFQQSKIGECNQKSKQFKIDMSELVSGAVMKLPESYTDIKPTIGGKSEPTENYNSINEKLTETEKLIWIDELKKINSEVNSPCSFSSFHSQSILAANLKEANFFSSSILLPLLVESINSPAMVRHCMDVIIKTISYLNPKQKVIITGDQPVYALGKQVQWNYQNRYSTVFWMMGPLHIEMAFLSTIGDWLEGSGWTELLEKSKINTTGRIESFLHGSKVKRSRYAHQVTLGALMKLSNLAFQNQNKFSSYDEWKEEISKVSVNAQYWFTVIELQTLLFTFIKSLRTSDFSLFLSCLRDILPWFFALDHTQYSRWMSVFLQDLLQISQQNPELQQEFMKGYFTVRKTNRAFSAMGIDQAHEQNNKIVKIDGGVIGILDNPKTLINWAVSGPVISNMLKFQLDHDCSEELNHHEDTASFEKQFCDDQEALLKAWSSFENPFEESTTNLIHVTTKHVLDDRATNSVKNAKLLGEQQYNTFVLDRLKTKAISLYNVIKRNNLQLFRSKHLVKMSKSKQKLSLVTADRRLYANLYVACQSRDGDLDNFFAHENHSFPVAISEYGKLCKCSNKSDFLDCLDVYVKPSFEPPDVDMKVIDGAAFVNANPPRFSST